MATTPNTESEQLPSGDGSGRFVGRIGALAVVLGVGAALGAAVASGPGVAAADTGKPAATESADTGTATSTPSTAGLSSGSTDQPNGPASEPTLDEVSASESDIDPPDEPSSTKGSSQRRSGASQSQTEPEPSASQLDEALDEASADETQVDIEETFEAETVRRTTGAVTTPAAIPSPEVIASAARTSETVEIAETESGPGDTSRAVDDPVAPAANPAPLALLGWTRRELGHSAAPATVTADAAAQTQAAQAVAVSPLATPEQLKAEKLATRTVKTLPVKLMKLILRLGFLSAAEKQFALVGGPDEANLAALDNAVDEYAMAAAFQQQLLNPMDPKVVMQVAPPHDWFGMDVGGSRILYDNPDTIYRFMAVNATSDYVIRGRFLDLTEGGMPTDTSFSVLEGLAGTTSSILTGDDLDVDENGYFEITVSREAAAPGQKNHLQLTSGSTIIAARNTLGDWNTEEPSTLSIERTSGPCNSLFAQLGGFVLLGSLVNDSPLLTTLVSLVPPLPWVPPVVRGTFTALILAVRGVSEQAKYMELATTDPDTGELRPPNQMSQPASSAEFLANQLQSGGYFQLTDEQALVLTIEPGNAGYFVVPIYNDWTITGDYWNEQTSLNNEQAVANPDGSYTLVISTADPGVANWVSTGGLNQGTISIRFQNVDTASPDLPTVASHLVSLDQLPFELPPTTEYVTPEQRQEQLDARLAGFNRRFAPYPQQ